MAFPRLSYGLPWFSDGFPVVLIWCHCFPIVFRGFPSSPMFFLTFLWCSDDFPMISRMIFLCSSYDVPFIFVMITISSWFSCDFRLILIWLSCVFPMSFLWVLLWVCQEVQGFVYGCPMFRAWFSCISRSDSLFFLWCPIVFPEVFLWCSFGSPMVFLSFSCGFPIDFCLRFVCDLPHRKSFGKESRNHRTSTGNYWGTKFPKSLLQFLGRWEVMDPPHPKKHCTRSFCVVLGVRGGRGPRPIPQIIENIVIS